MLNFVKEETDIRVFFSIEFINFFSSFLILPVLAIHLNSQLKFSYVQIGVLLTIPPLILSLFGLINQYIARKIGVYKALIYGFFLESLVFIAIFLKLNYEMIFIFLVIQGFGKAIWIPLYKTVYIESLKNKINVDLAFKFRYIFICIAAIFAPILSIFLYKKSMDIILYISILSFYLQIVLLYFNRVKIKDRLFEPNESKNSLYIYKNVLKKNGFLIYYLIGAISILTVFSQFESTFPLTINSKVDDPEVIFSILLIVNSIFGIIFQLIGMTILNKLSSLQNLKLGVVFFAISFFMFSTGILNIYFLVTTILFFTIGETAVLPNLDIIINDFSNSKNRALFFGIGELRKIGFFIGPILSSYLIELTGNKNMYLIFFGVSLSSLLSLTLLKKKTRREVVL